MLIALRDRVLFVSVALELGTSTARVLGHEPHVASRAIFLCNHSKFMAAVDIELLSTLQR